METKKVYKDIDEYISIFPAWIQNKLKELRAAIKKAAPEASERISYQMPAFYLFGNLVYFAAFKNHIGFYPTASGVGAFKSELAGFKCSKGAIQFPINEPLPIDLVTRIVTFRALENKNREKARRRLPGK